MPNQLICNSIIAQALYTFQACLHSGNHRCIFAHSHIDSFFIFLRLTKSYFFRLKISDSVIYFGMEGVLDYPEIKNIYGPLSTLASHPPLWVTRGRLGFRRRRNPSNPLLPLATIGDGRRDSKRGAGEGGGGDCDALSLSKAIGTWGRGPCR